MFKIIHSNLPVQNKYQDMAAQGYQRFLARKDIGFPDLPNRKDLWQSCQTEGQKLRNKFTQLVVVGIGGSSLGPRVIADVFDASNIFFLDNVDAIAFEKLLKKVGDLKKTAWVFTSKSGSTIETLCALEFLTQIYQEHKLVLSENALVVSEPVKNPLMEWAKKHEVTCLEIPLDVGGRYSVLSPVGMLPAAFMGLNVESFRQGAVAALQDKELVVSLSAHYLQSFAREEWISLFWFYCSSLQSFGLWTQQLWAESLAKKVDRRGQPAPRVSTPLSAIGAVDQHSILQQVMEGTKDKFVTFIRVEAAESGEQKLMNSDFSATQVLLGRTMGELLAAEAQATQEALNESGVSTLTIKTKVLDEQCLGYMFMAMQLIVAAIGESIDINAFDQPGVELGKRLAKEKLAKR